jgi:hypothetical protein
MPLPAISNTLAYLEPFLWGLALFAFLRTKNHTQFPALRVFLIVRVISAFLLAGIQHAYLVAPQMDAHLLSTYYFYSYWISYFVGFAVLLASLLDIFRYTMVSLPGLSRLGLIGFRWAAVVSLLVAFASIATIVPLLGLQGHLEWIVSAIACGLSVLELCLLAFLAVCMRSLGLTFRSRMSGLCLGFGMMAVMDLATAALRSTGVYAWPNQLSMLVTAAALLIWVAYLVMPEPVRKLAVLPAASPLLRWNDLALALGHSVPEAAAGQNGFLQNVEGVVDRVLAKNSMGSTG